MEESDKEAMPSPASKRGQREGRSNSVRLLSFLYALITINTMIVLAITSVVTDFYNPTIMLSLFAFMVGVSSIFLIVLDIFILVTNRRTKAAKKEIEEKEGNDTTLCMPEITVSLAENDGSENKTKSDEKGKDNAAFDNDDDGITELPTPILRPKHLHVDSDLYQRSISTISIASFISNTSNELEETMPDLPAVTYLESKDAHLPSFYLRMGSIAFGTGAMVYEGLSIASSIEKKLKCDTTDLASILVDSLSFISTFVQILFTFKHGKVSINRYKAICRFGYMHLLATNVAVWLITTAYETRHSLDTATGAHYTGHESAGENWHSSNASVNPVEHDYSSHNVMNNTCAAQLIIGNVLREAQRFLFPCIIEFSLILAVSWYRFYVNTGASTRIHKKYQNQNKGREKERINKGKLISVDCHRTEKGLFLGLILLTATIISVALFSILQYSATTKNLAVQIYLATMTVINVFSLITVIVAAIQIRALRFKEDHDDHEIDPDEILLIISLCGLYMFQIFLLIQDFEMTGNFLEIFYACSLPLFSIIQSTLQVWFIWDASKRSCWNKRTIKLKPGREAMIFLFICNIAFWLLDTLELREASLTIQEHNKVVKQQTSFFLISNLCTPLMIFFRFHSTVLLAETWKTAYTTRKKDK